MNLKYELIFTPSSLTFVMSSNKLVFMLTWFLTVFYYFLYLSNDTVDGNTDAEDAKTF